MSMKTISKWTKRPLALLAASALIGLAMWPISAARAQVTLEAKGENTQSLRAKKMEAEIQIKGAFSQTRVLTTFQNELSSQTEADFTYTVPSGAVVTGFAYWFKGEKVVARVVEKERALRIYDTIKNVRRDPALIEQIDATTFRARIFPIEPNADLKVEMRWTQVLPSDEKGLLYTLPLKPAEEGKGVLDELNVRASIRTESGISRVVNNYKLPLETEGDSQILTLAQKSYRAPQDLTIRLERPRRALHASLYSAPSGGRDGFFALAITPSQNIAKPRLAISGISTYGVLPARLSALKKDQTVIVVGRYRGSGAANVTLNGYASGAAQQKVLFSSTRENNSLATKLWAARQIEMLSPGGKVSAKNHERVVELSTRYSLPSFVTSWLAVPKAEWKNFERQIAEEDLYEYGPQLARLIQQGKGKSRPARRLRAAFNSACRVLGRNSTQALTEFLNQDRQDKFYAWQEQRNAAARKMAKAASLGQTRTVRAQSRRVALLNQRLGSNAKDGIRDSFDAELRTLSSQWANEKASAKPSAAQLRNLERRMARLESIAKTKASATRQEALKQIAQNEMWATGQKIAQEIISGNGESASVQKLRQSAQARGKYFGIDTKPLLDNATNYVVISRAQEIASKITNQQWSRKPDETQIKQEQEKLKRLIPGEEQRVKLLEKSEQNWAWQTGSFASMLVRERFKDKPDAAEIEYAQKRLERATRVQLREEGKDSKDEKAIQDAMANSIGQQESQFLAWKLAPIRRRLKAEQAFKTPDQVRIGRIQKEIDDMLQSVSDKGRELLKNGQNDYDYQGSELQTAREMLEFEYREAKPEPKRLNHFKKQMVARAGDDWYYNSGYGSARKITDPPLYQKTRAERIKVRVEKEKLDARLKTEASTLSASEKQVLSTQRAKLAASENELMVRMGDPLIQVEAPENAQQVIAIFPDGTIKKMTWNADAQKWETRFDVPTYAAEGQYSVQVAVVLTDGTRHNLTFRFSVDITAPTGKGEASRLVDNADKAVLRLEFQGDKDTARVEAILPWNEKIALAPSMQTEYGYFALSTLPPEYSQANNQNVTRVQFIVTDRAHNRTSVMVDMSR